MSKIYTKIVQSNTEPSKNDIWLKDGQMKTFGKEGWKPVGGGVSEGNNESVGDKEIYVLDATRTDYETLFNEVSEAWDSNKQIILNYMPEGYNVQIFDTLLTRCYKEEDSIVFGAGPVIIPSSYGSSCYMTPILIIIIFKDNITINDTSISEFTEESIGYIRYLSDDRIYLSSHGDGTEFLSDDGTYKPISTSNNEPYIFEYSEDLKNIDLEGLLELEEAIIGEKKIIIRYNSEDITPIIKVPTNGVFDGGVNFYFIGFVQGEGECLLNVHIASYDYSVSVTKHALNFQ